jgi:hypothetical protein
LGTGRVVMCAFRDWRGLVLCDGDGDGGPVHGGRGFVPRLTDVKMRVAGVVDSLADARVFWPWRGFLACVCPAGGDLEQLAGEVVDVALDSVAELRST